MALTIQTSDTDESQCTIIQYILVESMVRAIFGSNQIEHAGLGLDITVDLCRKVFRGEVVDDTGERTPDYLNKLAALYPSVQPLDQNSARGFIRGRREIVQHVQAFQHLIQAFVSEGNH
jgi:hypothetical protein